MCSENPTRTCLPSRRLVCHQRCSWRDEALNSPVRFRHATHTRMLPKALLLFRLYFVVYATQPTCTDKCVQTVYAEEAAFHTAQKKNNKINKQLVKTVSLGDRHCGSHRCQSIEWFSRTVAVSSPNPGLSLQITLVAAPRHLGLRWQGLPVTEKTPCA